MVLASISSFHLSYTSTRNPYFNSNLVQVLWHGHRSYPLLLSLLVDREGEAHLLPKDVPTCLC